MEFTQQQNESIQQRWDNLQDLANEWLDMFLKAYNGSDEGKTVLSEERLFCDEKGWTISGAIDLQEIHEENGFATVTVSDYKVTSVWSVIYGKEEWVNQLNCYAWLVRQAKGLSVTKLRIIAILRDWQRRRAEESGDYP